MNLTRAPESELDRYLEERKLTEEQLLRRLRDSFENHANFCARFKIRNKQGQQVTFLMSPAGAKVISRVEAQRKLGQPVRAQILKPRQAYNSATLATWLFKRVAFMRGQQGLVFGDTYKAARNIWGYIDQYNTTYKPGADGIAKLKLISRHKNEKLEWEGGSWVEVASADNVQAGRSFSLRHLLLSESAFWRDAETLRTGLIQCVPNDPDTTIFDESTANGASGPFYERWQEITDPSYTGGWLAIFFGWHEHPEYTMPLQVPRNQFQDKITRDEWDLIRQLRLTYEQVAWRRWCIQNNCDGSVERFHQEYPGTPEEAFLSTGRPRFCMISLGRMPVSRDHQAGELERVQVGTQKKLIFRPAADGRGPLQIFKRPAEGRKYVLGADPAEGIDAKKGKGGQTDPDYGVAYVADQDTGEQVACLHIRLEPDPFADYVCALGEFYNWAFLVPEINSVGLAFIQAILYRQYPVHLIYHRDREPDDRRPPMLQELGWKETEITRQQLISNHDRMIREMAISIRCPVCLREHRTFVIKADGRAEHDEGSHDDAVFAAALCSIGLQVAPRIRAIFERRPKPVQDIDPDDIDPRVNQAQRYGQQIGRRYR